MSNEEPTEVIEKRAFDAARAVFAPSVADGQEETLDDAAGAVGFHVSSTHLYGEPGRVFSLATDVDERLTWFDARPSLITRVREMGFTAAEIDRAVTAAARALAGDARSEHAGEGRIVDVAEAHTAALAEHTERPDAALPINMDMRAKFGQVEDADGYPVRVRTDYGRVVIHGDAALHPEALDELLVLIGQARAVAFQQAAELVTWEEPVA